MFESRRKRRTISKDSDSDGGDSSLSVSSLLSFSSAQISLTARTLSTESFHSLNAGTSSSMV